MLRVQKGAMYLLHAMALQAPRRSVLPTMQMPEFASAFDADQMNALVARGQLEANLMNAALPLEVPHEPSPQQQAAGESAGFGGRINKGSSKRAGGGKARGKAGGNTFLLVCGC